jgi:hypothetical protein
MVPTWKEELCIGIMVRSGYKSGAININETTSKHALGRSTFSVNLTAQLDLHDTDNNVHGYLFLDPKAKAKSDCVFQLQMRLCRMGAYEAWVEE